MEKDFNPNIREQTLELSINQLKIQCPSKTMVFGPSGSGKTTLVLNLLRNHYFTEEFSQIILCMPRMAINQMNETVEEYKKATNSFIQVRIKIVLEFFKNKDWGKKVYTSQNWPLVKNPQFLPYPHETWSK